MTGRIHTKMLVMVVLGGDRIRGFNFLLNTNRKLN